MTGQIAGRADLDAGTPRLSGIVRTSTLALATLQLQSSASAEVVQEGEAIGGWKVLRITDEDVTLSSGATILMLKPTGSATVDEPGVVEQSWHVGLRRSGATGTYLQRLQK